MTLTTCLLHFRADCACLRAKLLQLCTTLCDLMDHSLVSSIVHGILQARILEWVAMPSFKDLPDPGIEPEPLMSHALAGRFLDTSAAWEALASHYYILLLFSLCE